MPIETSGLLSESLERDQSDHVPVGLEFPRANTLCPEVQEPTLYQIQEVHRATDEYDRSPLRNLDAFLDRTLGPARASVRIHHLLIFAGQSMRVHIPAVDLRSSEPH